MGKKQKIIIFILIGIFLFSVFKIERTFANIETVSLTNVEIVNKSELVDVNSMNYQDKTIVNDITFHKVGDTVTYRITLKNNSSENYTIKTISDDNTNECITYEYDNYVGTKLNSDEEKTFNITAKYSAELTDMSKRKQSISAKFSFDFEDEKGNSKTEEIIITPTTSNNDSKNSNNNENNVMPNQKDYTDTTIATFDIPKTGDGIEIYITLAIISFFMIIILLEKKFSKSYKNIRKLFVFFIAVAILLPIISKANSTTLDISIQSLVKLYDKLVISREVNGEIIYETINYGDTMPKPEKPNKSGYTFKGWYLDDGTEYNFDTPITGDIKINPHFEIITYDITYNLNGGEASNPTTYTVEDEIRLNNPSKHGYTFTGWTGTGLIEKTENVIIDKASTGSRQYTANYIPTQYLILYELNGGIVTNPNLYTSEDEITLNNPTREGYNFTGWTGTGLTSNTENVTILKGSTENRIYKANWTPINYTITYEGLTSDEIIALNNPTTYNIETESITLNNPENRTDNDGDIVERFVAWQEDNTISINTKVPTGTTGNKVYTAIWKNVEPNSYIITYNLNGGHTFVQNPTNFTKHTETFTLNNPTKQGYTFIGWTGSNGNIPQTTVRVEKGTREDLNYIANYEIIKYDIVYNLDGGNAINDESYDVECDTIILNNPERTGYTFIGWSGTDLIGEENIIVTIPKGSTGDRTYTAHYKANKYTLIFNSNTGTGNMANQEIEYDKDTNIKVNSFTKMGYTFKEWNTKEDGTGTAYDDGQNIKNLVTNGTVTLYAQWKENTYIVEFNSNSGSDTQIQNQEFSYDERKALKANSYSKEGYTFIGWNTKENGTGILYNDEQEVINLTTEGNITLYAQWQANIYFIEFNANGGTGNQMENQKISYDEEVQLKSNTYTNENCIFMGWYTEPNASGTYYNDKQTVKNLTNINNQIITLYANWKEVKVGDYVNYNPASGDGTQLQYTSNDLQTKIYNDSTCQISGNFKSSESIRWRIFSLGEDGIQLIAEKPLINTLTLNGANGYIHGVDILNDICAIYGHGVGAVEGRSIKLEDVEPHFKYDKRSFTFGAAYYGQVKSYTSGNFIVGNSIVTATPTQKQNLTYTAYWFNIKNPAYRYTKQENATSYKIYQMLCEDISIINPNGNNPNYTPYWLASKCTRADFCMYALHYIGDMHSGGNEQVELGVRSMYKTDGTTYPHENRILPIVKLNSSVQLKCNSDNSDCWDIDYTPVNYTISFNSNGGIGEMQDEEFEKGIGKKLTKNTFERNGFVFNGWNTKPDGSGTNYGNEQLVKKLDVNAGDNIKLYAMWINLKVGDYINYNSSSGDGFGIEFDKTKLLYGTSISGDTTNNFKSKEIQKWRVFSTTDGVIQLVAEKPTTQTIHFEGNMGYKNCVEVLNEIAKIYGKGIGASSGRSITLEDIEPYFKYDRTLFSEKDTSHNFTVRYGDTKTYTSGTFLNGNEFVTATPTASQTATQTAYWYNINEDVYYTEEENEIANKIYNMLCVDIPVSNGSDSEEYMPYALANTCVYLRHDCTQNYVRYIGDLHGYGYPEMGGVWLSTSNGATGQAELHVLPIVTLDSSAMLSRNDATDSWDINIVNGN